MNTPEKCDYDCTHCGIRYECDKNPFRSVANSRQFMPNTATLLADIMELKDRLETLHGIIKFRTRHIKKDNRIKIWRKAIKIHENRKAK